MEQKKLYLNKPQARSYLLYPNEEIAIWGRGTGKSEGLLAPRILRWCMDMPRGAIGIVASTYQQHLTRTLPAIIKGWEKFGFIQDRDWVIGRFADKSWGWEIPFLRPLRTDYFIHTRFGTGIHLISQDRPGSANGLSLDAHAGDEAKFLNKERYDNELLPAIRGNDYVFGSKGCHQAFLLASDMPVSNRSLWLLDHEKNHDQERAEMVVALSLKISELENRCSSPNYTPASIATFQARINTGYKMLDTMRRGDPDNGIPPFRYFSIASSFENIDILRPSYFEKMLKSMSPGDIRTSLLSERLTQITDGFYPDLDEEIHGYESYRNDYLELMGYNFSKLQDPDSRHDGDCQSDLPLHISLDYGAYFNCMGVAQMEKETNTINLINSPWIRDGKIRDLIKKFKSYYRHHRDKTVYYYWDNTAKPGNAANDILYYEEVISELRADDEYGSWRVISKPQGNPVSYHTRYELWKSLLSLKDKSKPFFRYNIHNANQWSISAMTAPIKRVGNKIEKDKSSEKRRSNGYRVDPERATHLSEAVDVLVLGMTSLVSSESQFHP